MNDEIITTIKTKIKKIKKRDGRIVDFNPDKIATAIWKAAKAVGGKDRERPKVLAEQVVRLLEKKLKPGEVPTVEQVQDLVEKVLVENGHYKTAKAYILYRRKRAEARKACAILGVKDELKLPLNTIVILAARYLLRDEERNIIETTSQLFKRVAKTIAAIEKKYGKSAKKIKELEEKFYQMLVNSEFLPNSPTLMNTGTGRGLTLSACFVIPIEDDMSSIFDAIKMMALVQKAGGGTGFSFNNLRPAGDVVKSTGGVASGPISFMKIFDAATEQIKQGGKRRGANMGVLRVDHPDILDFIVCKEVEGVLRNFNISVGVTDRFMRAVERDGEIDLINPRTGKPTKRIKARAIWNLLATMAWKNGEPGIIFLDTINKYNPTPHVGMVESTNPCGEQPLLSYESCNLGSINLSKIVEDGKINWNKLRNIVRLAVRFLDNVIDANSFPTKEIEKATKANRKIGLGVMGFADMLIKLEIPYNSQKALKLAEKIMRFITQEARKTSVKLGKEKGNFPNFKGSVWDKRGYKYMRNATVTTIAPTGTISEIAGCSQGIEPLFAIAYVRNVRESLGYDLTVINPLFEMIAIREGFYSEELIKKIAGSTSIQHVKEIPEKWRKIFVTALDISPEWHVRMQAAFQKYTDNAVSKTVNLPHHATPDDVERIFLLAWKLGCKGITVYRFGSRRVQVIRPIAEAAAPSWGRCEICEM
jgi:ribonucleoside-diphosphate reductase alpha chain